ncbi:unnamed protein product [Cercospora beticola]|nr:unnamed protein product [Cercospora beticola]
MSCFESRGGTSSCGQFWLLEFGATRTSCNDHICGTDMMTERCSLQNLPIWSLCDGGMGAKRCKVSGEFMSATRLSVVRVKQTGAAPSSDTIHAQGDPAGTGGAAPP